MGFGQDSEYAPKVIVIIGQTASGKSSLAVSLASELRSIVICADAFQVYRKFAVASDKILHSEMHGVQHFGLDLVDPGEEFNVKDFLNLVVPLIDSELSAGRCPIVIGGTHMYIEKLLFTSRIDSDELSVNSSPIGRQYSFDHLRAIDPNMAKRLHPNDERRWSRAIDFFYDTGYQMSEVLCAQSRELRWKDVIVLEKTVEGDQATLERMIRDRIDRKMLLNDSLKNELMKIKTLVDAGSLKWRKGLLQAIGYREFEKYLTLLPAEGAEKLFQEGIEEMVRNTVRYSKKQKKWIKKLATHLEIFPVKNFDASSSSFIHANKSRVKSLPAW